MSAFLDFIRMGGYGFYIWTAYGLVLAFLLTQWFYPWRRLQKYLREQSTKP